MRKSKFLKGLSSILIAASLLTGCGLGGSKDIKAVEDIGNTVTGIESLQIPEGVRIVALGEATHGNREFQQSKREVFQILNEKQGIKALIIEGDFGGCSLVNDYVQGGEGDTHELTKHLGYRLYRTSDMEDLIKYMRQYNDSAADSEKIRFYGMDIQKGFDNKAVLEGFYDAVDAEKKADFTKNFESTIGTEDYVVPADKVEEINKFLDGVEADLASNKDAYVGKTDVDSYFRATLAVTALKHYVALNTGADYNRFRDDCMREIVKKVLEFEENEHGSELMLACHNGHMTKNQSSNFTFLGKDLYDELGSAYYAIGTDFYITNCNLPGSDGRIVKEFCSDDPLAFSMKDMDMKCGLIQFENVVPGTDLSSTISDKIPTGSLGEGYSTGMEYMKNSYQLKFPPKEMYDAMILYYEVTPTEIWTD